jgi:hypothetical protein
LGLRDILTGRHQVKGPAPDRLFAITTAYVDLQAEHQIDPSGSAAIVFQALATSEFEATIKDMEEVVTATGGDSGTSVKTEDDSYGYRWMILRNPDGAPSVEDLAVGINAVSSSIETAGFGERLGSRSTSSTTTSAARGTRSCPRQATAKSARPSASCSSRRRSAQSCRWRPKSSAGSRCGGSRSSRESDPRR